MSTMYVIFHDKIMVDQVYLYTLYTRKYVMIHIDICEGEKILFNWAF